MGAFDPLDIAEGAGADHLVAHTLVADGVPAGFAFDGQVAAFAQVKEGFGQDDAQVDDDLVVVDDFHDFRGALGNGGFVIALVDAHNFAPGADAAGLGGRLDQEPEGMADILSGEFAIAVLPLDAFAQVESPIPTIRGHFPGSSQLRDVGAAGVVHADQVFIDRPLVEETADVDLVGVVGVPRLAAHGDANLVHPVVHGDLSYGRGRFGLRNRGGYGVFLPGGLRPGGVDGGRGLLGSGGAAIGGGRAAAGFLLGRLAGGGRFCGRGGGLLLRRSRLGRRGRFTGRSRRFRGGGTTGDDEGQG